MVQDDRELVECRNCNKYTWIFPRFSSRPYKCSRCGAAFDSFSTEKSIKSAQIERLQGKEIQDDKDNNYSQTSNDYNLPGFSLIKNSNRDPKLKEVKDIPINSDSCQYCGIQNPPVKNILNNRLFICDTCYDRIEQLRYPEHYRAKIRQYEDQKEKHRFNYEKYLKELEESLPVGANNRYYVISKTLTFMIIVLAILLILLEVASIDNLLLMAFVCCVTGILSLYFKGKTRTLRQEHLQHILSWKQEFPEPKIPSVREYFDPNATLTKKDKKIYNILLFWPAYPPYWDSLREYIINRDGKRCQVTGCPNRTRLHVHHCVPLSKGGSHGIENLVTLCVFHHGVQPDAGHDRIWGEIKTQYFSMVRAHLRNGYPVRAHVRRKELTNDVQLTQIIEYYRLSCSECSDFPFRFSIDYAKNLIYLYCGRCNQTWNFRQKIVEENGPELANVFKVARNEGRWKTDVSLIEGN